MNLDPILGSRLAIAWQLLAALILVLSVQSSAAGNDEDLVGLNLRRGGFWTRGA